MLDLCWKTAAHDKEVPMKPQQNQYIVDSHGRPKAVLLSLKEYKRLLEIAEDARDAAYIRAHRNEKLIPMEDVHPASSV